MSVSVWNVVAGALWGQRLQRVDLARGRESTRTTAKRLTGHGVGDASGDEPIRETGPPSPTPVSLVQSGVCRDSTAVTTQRETWGEWTGQTGLGGVGPARAQRSPWPVHLEGREQRGAVPNKVWQNCERESDGGDQWMFCAGVDIPVTTLPRWG